MRRKISGARRKEAPSSARTRAPKRKQRDATSKSSSQPGPAERRRRPRRAAATAAIAAMNANTTRERRKHGSSFVEVCWWHMTFVVLPGRPPHPGIVQDDATDVWKSSGRLWPSRRRTTRQNSGKAEQAVTGRELAAGESTRWRRIRTHGGLPHRHIHLVDNI